MLQPDAYPLYLQAKVDGGLLQAPVSIKTSMLIASSRIQQQPDSAEDDGEGCSQQVSHRVGVSEVIPRRHRVPNGIKHPCAGPHDEAAIRHSEPAAEPKHNQVSAAAPSRLSSSGRRGLWPAGKRNAPHENERTEEEQSDSSCSPTPRS